jgi:hypothetical protein
MSKNWYPQGRTRTYVVPPQQAGLFAITIRPVRVGQDIIPANTKVEMFGPQMERNEMIRVKVRNKFHAVDPIDFRLPEGSLLAA